MMIFHSYVAVYQNVPDPNCVCKGAQGSSRTFLVVLFININETAINSPSDLGSVPPITQYFLGVESTKPPWCEG